MNLNQSINNGEYTELDTHLFSAAETMFKEYTNFNSSFITI